VINIQKCQILPRLYLLIVNIPCIIGYLSVDIGEVYVEKRLDIHYI